ncbi:type II toxin-antitoxin system VapC family toxin [Oryzicola mucosus]|uniref:Type II toxin-antitoxin system VapC family toxin n=1 Tax=Oryzicola mucosus TaxID=2767425 RepID=A0A8J6PWG9_9HYPH|nr:type II toxin-antitoxin system VapC family toxin [Oryzicola mucosus]MBD0415433.1 type II toxin-antitoxin system VapC family toxin [Oryzicola mucosus]
MVYVDTSILVSALTVETRSLEMQQWLIAASQTDGVLISEWTITEFSSALSVKERTGQLTWEGRGSALQSFRALIRDTFEVRTVTRQHFLFAAGLSDQSKIGFRASDALHAAVVILEQVTLATLDRRLAAAMNEGGASCLVP